MKTIQLKVTKIKYRGDSVGDDVEIKVNCLNSNLDVKKKIKNKSEVKIDAVVGQFVTDQALFSLPVNVKIIERDLVFNDVGSKDIELKVDMKTSASQFSTYEILVKEKRGLSSGGRIGTFEVTLEASILDFVKYIPDDDSGDGWLKARFEDNGSVESLPAFLKVKTERIDNKREYITPLEGPYSGRLASISLLNNQSRLISGVTHAPMGYAKYSISKKTFILNGKEYQTADYPGSPWKKGLYDIEIPDYPHTGGRYYLKQSKRAMTWFRIGHSGDRYLHTGGRSLGCITIIDIAHWMNIYNELIKARKEDSLSVGVLEVID